jgi:hypothetical protein
MNPGGFASQACRSRAVQTKLLRKSNPEYEQAGALSAVFPVTTKTFRATTVARAVTRVRHSCHWLPGVTAVGVGAVAESSRALSEPSCPQAAREKEPALGNRFRTARRMSMFDPHVILSLNPSATACSRRPCRPELRASGARRSLSAAIYGSLSNTQQVSCHLYKLLLLKTFLRRDLAGVAAIV